MRGRISILAAASLVWIISVTVAHSQSTFDTAVADLKHGYFDRTYNGKDFLDSGEVEEYSRRAGWNWNGKKTPPYIQIFNFKKGVSKSWCVLSEKLFKQYQSAFPVGTKVTMKGKMASWYLADETLLLDENCSIGPDTGKSGPFDMNVVVDLKSYFEKTYKGKKFSDAGLVSSYSPSDRTIAIASLASPPDLARCSFDQQTYNSLQMKFPAGSKIRVTGTMSEWAIRGLFSNVHFLGLKECAISAE